MDRLAFIGILGASSVSASQYAAGGGPSASDSRVGLANLRTAVVTVAGVHIGILEDQGSVAIASLSGQTRVLNLPRPPKTQVEWRQQLAPKKPIINPENRTSPDVVFGAMPDPVSVLTRIGPFAFVACSAGFDYNYITRIDPRDDSFLTMVINPIGLPLAMYADVPKLVIIGNQGSSQIVPLAYGTTASYPKSDDYESRLP
jgi:hypothetical protein